jgi:hypothetical protein
LSWASDPAFDPRSVHVRLVVNEVALGQVLLRGLRSSPVSSIPPMLHTHIWFIYHRPYTILATDRSVKSDTSSHMLCT